MKQLANKSRIVTILVKLGTVNLIRIADAISPAIVGSIACNWLVNHQNYPENKAEKRGRHCQGDVVSVHGLLGRRG